MKKQVLNIGKALNKVEQRTINGGYMPQCISDEDCSQGATCHIPSAICYDPNAPLFDVFGCDTNPYTNPHRVGC